MDLYESAIILICRTAFAIALAQAMLLSFMIWGILAFLSLLAGGPVLPNAMHIFAHHFLRFVIYVGGVRLELSGPEDLPRAGELVLVNHGCAADIFFCLAIFRHPFRCVGKKELFTWRPMAAYLRSFRPFALPRGDLDAAKEMLQEVEKALRARETCLLMPEGTRNPAPGRLLPLKMGAFWTAQAAGAPLLLVHLHSTALLCPRRGWLPRPGRLCVRLLARMAPDTTPHELRDRATEIFERGRGQESGLELLQGPRVLPALIYLFSAAAPWISIRWM